MPTQKIAIFLASLRGGGAERNMLRLANSFAEQGIKVDLVLAQKDGIYFSEVSPQVNLVHLEANRVLLSLPKLVRYLKQEKPAYLICALNHINLVGLWAKSLAGVSTRIIVTVRNTLSSESNQSTWKNFLINGLIHHCYPWSDSIVAVSGGVADNLAATVNLPRNHIKVIYNPVVTPNLLLEAKANIDHPWFTPREPPVILGVGRLTKQKDFPTLIKAFAIAQQNYSARLMILGEGEERPQLEALIKELGLEDKVSLPGFVNNPFAYMAQAALFVLSSAWEGLPTVLIEAMAVGTPVVATNCKSGPEEIIAGGEYGNLVSVGDVEGLAKAMVATLNNPIAPEVLQSRAKQEFSQEKSVTEYLKLMVSMNPADQINLKAQAEDLPNHSLKMKPTKVDNLPEQYQRITFLITRLDYGGREVQLVQLASQLKNRGWNVQVVSMISPQAFTDKLAALGIPVHSLGMQRGIPNITAILKLAKIVKNFQPYFLHSHLVHANLLARVTRLFVKVPILISTAGNIKEGKRWREIAYRLTDPWCDLTTNVSKLAVEHYIEAGAVPQDKIVYIPNSVDTDKFAPNPEIRASIRQELSLGEKFTWLAVGRLEKQKDYPTMLKAFAQLSQQFPKSLLLICGQGYLRDQLENLVKELSLQDRVKFLGVRSNIPEIMNGVDGYVMSSAWEGMPGVLLEASATGLPIVATNVSGNREVVLDGKTGFLVPPHNFEVLAKTMQILMELPLSERQKMGQLSREYIVDNYSCEQGVIRWLELYYWFLNQPKK